MAYPNFVENTKKKEVGLDKRPSGWADLVRSVCFSRARGQDGEGEPVF